MPFHFFFSLSPCIPQCLCAVACLKRQSQRAPQRAVSACAPAPVNLRRSDIVFWMLNWMQASRLICIRCANALDDVLIHGTTNKPFRAFPCEARSAPPPLPALMPPPLSWLPLRSLDNKVPACSARGETFCIFLFAHSSLSDTPFTQFTLQWIIKRLANLSLYCEERCCEWFINEH